MIPIKYPSMIRISRNMRNRKNADWILNGGIEEEWDSYLDKMEKYGLSDYLKIKQKYFDQYQDLSRKVGEFV